MVKNVRKCTKGEKLKIYTNRGELENDEIADSLLLPLEMYFNEESITNVMSLKQVVMSL